MYRVVVILTALLLVAASTRTARATWSREAYQEQGNQLFRAVDQAAKAGNVTALKRLFQEIVERKPVTMLGGKAYPDPMEEDEGYVLGRILGAVRQAPASTRQKLVPLLDLAHQTALNPQAKGQWIFEESPSLMVDLGKAYLSASQPGKASAAFKGGLSLFLDRPLRGGGGAGLHNQDIGSFILPLARLQVKTKGSPISSQMFVGKLERAAGEVDSMLDALNDWDARVGHSPAERAKLFTNLVNVKRAIVTLHPNGAHGKRTTTR